jgi:hypothetical protein
MEANSNSITQTPPHIAWTIYTACTSVKMSTSSIGSITNSSLEQFILISVLFNFPFSNQLAQLIEQGSPGHLTWY